MPQQIYPKSVQVIIFFLKTLGVEAKKNESNENNIPVRLLLILTPVFFVYPSMFAFLYLRRHEFNEAIITAAYLGGAIFMCITSYSLYKNGNLLKLFVEEISQETLTYEEEISTSIYYSWALREENYLKICLLIAGNVSFGFSVASLSPLYAYLATKQFTCYIIPSWYPWSDQTTLGFLAILVSQLLCALVAFWFYFSILAILVFVLIEFSRLYENLRTALITMKVRANSFVMVSFADEMPKENMEYVNYGSYVFRTEHKVVCNRFYEEQIIKCIKHHQRLTRYLMPAVHTRSRRSPKLFPRRGGPMRTRSADLAVSRLKSQQNHL